MAHPTTHGHTLHHRPTRIYRIWDGMKARCLRPSHPYFQRYGGRGIGVCERWAGARGFENFLEDMGEPPTAQHTLDRIDNNGPYEPGNCRWATKLQQASNRRDNRYVTYCGEQITLSEFARRAGVSVELATWRINHGQSPEEAAKPPRPWKRKSPASA